MHPKLKVIDAAWILSLLFVISIASCKKSGSNNTPPLPPITSKSVINWKTTIGGTSDDNFRETTSIVKSSDGGYVTVGITASRDGDITNYHGLGDILLTKVDNKGNKIWAKAIGGSFQDDAYSITGTSDGGYIIAGFTGSNDGDITINHGVVDAWVIKLDGNGTIQWQKTYGGTDFDEVVSIVETSDGYICAGASSSSNGDVTINKGQGDGWIFKIDKNGKLLWSKIYGGSGEEYFQSMTSTTDGNYIAIGYTTSNDGDIKNNHGNGDMWVLKFDPNGNLIWSISVGGSNQEYGINVTNSEDGGYFITGSTKSSNGDIISLKGSGDAVVGKLDANGNKIWIKTYGSSAYDIGNSLITTSNHNIVVAGVAYAHDGDVIAGTTDHDAWVFKLDNTGKILSQATFGGSANDEAMAIIETSSNSFVMCGFTGSVDGDFAPIHGGTDIFMVSFDLK